MGGGEEPEQGRAARFRRRWWCPQRAIADAGQPSTVAARVDNAFFETLRTQLDRVNQRWEEEQRDIQAQAEVAHGAQVAGRDEVGDWGGKACLPACRPAHLRPSFRSDASRTDL